MTNYAPLIGIPASYRDTQGFRVHAVGQVNIDAVANVARGIPMMIPAIGDRLDVHDLLAGLDGIMLTGGATNVEPVHYDGAPSREGDSHDPRRDATSLPLIRAAVDLGVPLFAVCRGFQEFNVALGGSLHQHLQEVPGRFDHRRDRTKPIETQMEPIHSIAIEEDSVLAAIAGATDAMVNSLHGQGVDKPAPGMAVEAVATDGTIEALSVTGAPGFALGVQWHPEFQAEDDPLSRALFVAFGDAARQRAAVRRGTRQAAAE
jgi:putative glutamine amidotransferase